METPNDATRAAFLSALPDDDRVRRGQMFGHPCAFVGDNLFLGTFAQTLIFRLGEARAAALIAAGAAAPFAPQGGRTWRAYVCVPVDSPEAANLAALAREALEHAAGLPPKNRL